MAHVLTVAMIHIAAALRTLSVAVTMVTQARVVHVKVIRWLLHTLHIFTQLLLTYHNTDIDECEDNSTCAYREGTVCVNTVGSYDCVCEEGYITCDDYSYECTRKLT